MYPTSLISLGGEGVQVYSTPEGTRALSVFLLDGGIKLRQREREILALGSCLHQIRMREHGEQPAHTAVDFGTAYWFSKKGTRLNDMCTLSRGEEISTTSTRSSLFSTRLQSSG